MSSTYKHTLERNARLDVLHSRGLINVTNSDALNISHNTIANVFDRDNTNTSMIVLNNDEDPAFTEIAIVGEENAPLANRLDMFVGVVLAGNIVINEGDVDEFTVNYVVPNRTSFYTFQTRVDIPFPRTVRVKKITINYTSFDPDENATSNDVRLYGVDLYRNVHKSDLIEFDDAVLETKGWNSSRYSGRQLQGTKINTFREGDTSYAGTPTLSSFSRTFYLANEIISLSGSGHTPFSDEDDTLHKIPGFSYITVNRSLTINSDDSIELTDINTFNEDNIDPNTGINYSSQLRGFDREFRSNLPIGSQINLRTLDDEVKQRSLRSLNVFYNEGRLRQLFIFGNANNGTNSGLEIGIAHSSATSWQLYRTISETTVISGSLFIRDNARTLTSKFYTGSLASGFGPTTKAFGRGLNAIGEVKSNNRTVQDNRLFVTALKGIVSKSSDTTLYDDIPSNFVYNYSNPTLQAFYGAGGSLGDAPVFTGEVLVLNNSASSVFNSNDLDELSTFEISEIGGSSIQALASLKKQIKTTNTIYGLQNRQKVNYSKPRSYTFDYTSNGDLVGEGNASDTGIAIKPDREFGGSYSVSVLDTSIPSLLVDLNKTLEYPEGKGNKPLLLLPPNLHPFIKDNLIHFMANAGFDIGDRRVVPEIDETNRNLL
jgi:hypothetical protein